MDEEKVCQMVLYKWNELKEIVSCLKVLYQATIAMQKEDFKLSDFYATWLYIMEKLREKLKRGNITNLANHLLEMLERRTPQLLENPAVISALALDPRFCNDLDDDQKKTAITSLTDLWERLMQQDLPSIETITLDDAENSSDEDITIANTTILSKFKRNDGQTLANRNSFDIRSAISLFMAESHDIPEITILEFWILNKVKYPELYSLAEIILAISPTQAVVERSFSVLSYIFNSYRNRLSEEMIDDISIISLNKDLFYAINEKDLNSLMLVS